MVQTAKPGHPLPDITFTLTDGTKVVSGDFTGGWAMLVVYRGHHCGRCKPYVAKLEALRSAYEARGVRLLIASADPLELAQRTMEEEGWTLPVAFGLTVDQMRALSLFVTDPGPDSDIHGPYAEPGLYLTNPAGDLQVMCTSNAPSARPDLDIMLDGIIGTQDRNLPIRGTY